MNTISVWRATAPQAGFPTLQEEVTADVVIVGGGITGVTLALSLAEQGTSAVLLEAHTVGFGSTGNSTGNLYETVSKGIHHIVELWDSETARAVATARRAAVEQIDQRVRQFDIPCAFRRCRLYRYATSENAWDSVEKEYQGSLKAGLSVHLEKTLPTPLAPPAGPVLALDNQAQFHPQAYVRGLAHQAASQGCRIYENSTVIDVDKDKRVVRTHTGKVTAREIVFATHSPKGVYRVQAEMIANREYGLATRIARNSFPTGIFWGTGIERLSIRNVDVDDATFLVCVGEVHKTGQENAKISLDRLESSAQAHFNVREAAFKWSAQNYSTADGLPYIGRDATGCFIATGFEPMG